MIEPIGQRLDSDSVVLEDRYEDRNLSYQERQAIRELRLKPTANEAARRLYEAEAGLSFARDRLGTASVNFLLGEIEEADVREIEDEIAEHEREGRRWKTACRELDTLTGVIRDAAGNVLR